MENGFRSPSSPLFTPSSIILTARVSNTGGVQIPAGLPVAFYLGDLDTGGAFISVATTDDPKTVEDEEAQPGDTVRLIVDGQIMGSGIWMAHGGRWRVPLVQK